MRSVLKRAALVACLVAVAGMPALSHAAKDKAAAKEKPATEEKAAQVMDKACKALTALGAATFHADVSLDKVYQDGSKIQSHRSMQVSLARPGSFKVVTEGDEFSGTSVYDGKLFTVFLPGKNVYGQVAFVGDNDTLIDELATKYGLEAPLSNLLSNQPCARLAGAAVGFYVGKSKVGDAACDQLFYQGKELDWQLWVDEATGLPRKIVITEKKLKAAPQFTAVLSGWKAGDVAAQTFAFAAPAGAVRDDAVITGAKPAK